MPIDPNTGQESAQSLLDLMQPGAGQADPYAGKTIAQILQGGAPYADMPGWSSADYGGGGPSPGSSFAADWANQPATNENVSAGIQRGGRYDPEFAKTLQSSGQEGGFFSIPGVTTGTEVPWGYYPNPNDPGAASGDPNAKNPAPGLIGMSTNNWRLLPKQFQDPNYAMRAGHIIDRSRAGNLGGYLGHSPMGETVSRQTHILGVGGHGYPLSYGYPFGPRASFFPGQLEPWTPETPSAMGAGVT